MKFQAFEFRGRQYVCIDEWPEKGTVFMLDVETGDKKNVLKSQVVRGYRFVQHNQATRRALSINDIVT